MEAAGWVNWREIFIPEILDVPYAIRPVGNNGANGRLKILNLLAAFDVETSRIPETDQTCVYHWQLQLGIDHPTIEGRELWEFRKFTDQLAEAIKPGDTLRIYVHSLAYEFHFLRSVYPEIEPGDVFSLAPRKPVKLKLYKGKIELRCSYALTNMSLGQWTKKMGVPHAKLDGDDYDHSIIRYPWTPMTPDELQYCQNDVLGLVEALQKQLEIYGDTLASIPLTSTGYVRRDVKRTMKNWSYWGMQSVQPEDEVYIALREAFRGGNTHGNRYMAGNILDKVSSMDRSSSYPEVIVNGQFPMGHFQRSYRQTWQFCSSLRKMGRAVLVRLRFTGLELRDPYDPCPYISFSKITGCTIRDCKIDNGRILSSPQAVMTVTDVDLRIIEKQYTWTGVDVLDMWDTSYGLLPDMLRSLIISYYDNKTKLKGVKGQEVYYDKAKALLNSIYGLQAQDPCRETVTYTPDDPDGDLFSYVEGDIPALLAKSRRNAYGSYQWGVWVTALARWELQQAIWLAGDNFVYADTDSVKFIGDLSGIDQYNKQKIKISTSNGGYADDPAGHRHYMGVFEYEGTYDRFITYGAKKYAYEINGKLGITIAGVNKKKGAAELAAAGGLEALKLGFVFRDAGGQEPVYNDKEYGQISVEGHDLYIGSNIYLRSSTYTIGVTSDYLDILRDAEVLRRLRHEKQLKKALLPGLNINN